MTATAPSSFPQKTRSVLKKVTSAVPCHGIKARSHRWLERQRVPLDPLGSLRGKNTRGRLGSMMGCVPASSSRCPLGVIAGVSATVTEAFKSVDAEVRVMLGLQLFVVTRMLESSIDGINNKNQT